MWTFLLVLPFLNVEYVYSNPDNYKFKMLENFEINKENFIEELKIVKLLQAHKEKMKSYRDFLKSRLDEFKQKSADKQLPISSKHLLQRFYHYKSLAKMELEHFETTQKQMKNLGNQFPVVEDFTGMPNKA